jgi:hypothetical protein
VLDINTEESYIEITSDGDVIRLDFNSVVYSCIADIADKGIRIRTITDIEVGILLYNIDSKLKNEIRYKDDLETLKSKLEMFKVDTSDNDNDCIQMEGNKLDTLENDEKEWNQFVSNKNKFNIESTYKENLYTTEFDVEVIPDELKQKAEIIEKVMRNLLMLGIAG